MHGSKDPHQCKVCNYRATTRQIIVYHEMNHHIDHTLAAMTKNAILAPDAVSVCLNASMDNPIIDESGAYRREDP